MATTTQGEQLTQQNRAAQLALAAATAAAVAKLWASTVRPADLAATYAIWLERIIPLIERDRPRAAKLAASYATRFRQVEHHGSRLTFEPLDNPADLIDRLEVSMRATGLIPASRATRLLRGQPSQPDPTLERKVDQLVRQAGRTASASAFRYVADGARETLVDITYGPARQDAAALGYVRVTRDKPCAFCAVLASRGPVYSERSFEQSDPRFEGLGHEKVHDGCACSLEPVYDETTKWPGRARDFENLWLDSDGTLSGFQKLYRARNA